jgi:hypothetical protein
MAILETLGEWEGTHLHGWLKIHSQSVRDVESWALTAWTELYQNEKENFESDVKRRATKDWPMILFPSEAIAEEPKV